MPDFDEQYFRKLAGEARMSAGRVSDPFSKRAMLQVAKNYDNLAERAAQRAAAAS